MVLIRGTRDEVHRTTTKVPISPKPPKLSLAQEIGSYFLQGSCQGSSDQGPLTFQIIIQAQTARGWIRYRILGVGRLETFLDLDSFQGPFVKLIASKYCKWLLTCRYPELSSVEAVSFCYTATCNLCRTRVTGFNV